MFGKRSGKSSEKPFSEQFVRRVCVFTCSTLTSVTTWAAVSTYVNFVFGSVYIAPRPNSFCAVVLMVIYPHTHTHKMIKENSINQPLDIEKYFENPWIKKGHTASVHPLMPLRRIEFPMLLPLITVEKWAKLKIINKLLTNWRLNHTENSVSTNKILESLTKKERN